MSKVDRKAYLSSADVMLARLDDVEGQAEAVYAGGASWARRLIVGKSRSAPGDLRLDSRVSLLGCVVDNGSRNGLLVFQDVPASLTPLTSRRESLHSAWEDDEFLRANLSLVRSNIDLVMAGDCIDEVVE